MKFFQAVKKWIPKAFNLDILKKNRFIWVDYLRGIAIILVVYRHSLIGIERTGTKVASYLVNANMVFYSFRMPLFFIIAGLFISASLSRKSLKDVIYIKFENLLYPYLVWAFLQITLQIIFSKFTNAARTLTDYSYIFYHPRVLDQFWYLPALFNVTIIYIIVKKYFRIKPWLQMIIGICFYLISPLFRNVSMISDFMEFYIFFSIGDFVSQFFFNEASQHFIKKTSTLLLLIPAFILIQFFYLRNKEEYYWNNFSGQIEFILIALVGCVTMFAIAFRLQYWNILRFLRVIGYHSLYIYIMHVLIIAFIRIIFIKIFHITYSPLLLLVSIVLGVLLPIVIYNLLVKNKIGWFLFSFREQSNKS